MNILFRIDPENSKKILIDTPEPIVGHFLSSFFSFGLRLGEDDFLRDKNKILSFLSRVDYENSTKVHFGTYNDLFIKLFENRGNMTVRFFDGLSADVYSYPGNGWETSVEDFMKILNAYIKEYDEFKSNPEAYKAELDKFGGEKVVEL